MSVIDSGMAFANPFSPLHQSLLRTMPNAANMGSQFSAPVGADDQATTLVRAGNLRTGRVSAGQMLPGGAAARLGSPGPMGQSVAKYKLALMAAVGMSEEDQDKFKPIVEDPNISPQALQQLLHLHQKTKAVQPPPESPAEQPNHGASIGGPTPANTPPGSIRITQGSGRDGRAVMSQDAMQQWMQRAQQTAPAGEHVSQISGTYTPTLSKAGMDEWNRLMPGQALPVRSTPVANHGFQVNGVQPPAQQQAQAPDPIQGMFNTLKQAGADENSLAQWQAFAQAGATPQQLHQAGQQILARQYSQSRDDRADRREQQNMRHSEFSENARVLDELQKQEKGLLEQNPELQSGSAKDPNVMKDWMALQGQIQNVRARMNQAVTPSQHQSVPGVGQPAVSQWRGNAYQLGQVIQTPHGPARVAGFGPDGHPLMQLSGR